MKKGQIINAVLFVALIVGLLPYLPKQAQDDTVQVKSTIEVPVDSMIIISRRNLTPSQDKIIADAIEDALTPPAYKRRTLTFNPSTAGTGSYNTAIGYKASVNATGQNNAAINRAINKRLNKRPK